MQENLFGSFRDLVAQRDRINDYTRGHFESLIEQDKKIYENRAKIVEEEAKKYRATVEEITKKKDAELEACRNKMDDLKMALAVGLKDRDIKVAREGEHFDLYDRLHAHIFSDTGSDFCPCKGLRHHFVEGLLSVV